MQIPEYTINRCCRLSRPSTRHYVIDSDFARRKPAAASKNTPYERKRLHPTSISISIYLLLYPSIYRQISRSNTRGKEDLSASRELQEQRKDRKREFGSRNATLSSLLGISATRRDDM
ncbi:uncharacterized [Tachysurus ichikawai]